MRGRSKRRQTDRKIAGSRMLAWLEVRNVSISPNLETKMRDGFGVSEEGEDPFDAVVGLCGMLDVVLGNRQPSPKLLPLHLEREGWIFGHSQSDSFEPPLGCRRVQFTNRIRP